MKDRYLRKSMANDLSQKMVFIGGPRQVGKTTLAQLIGTKENIPCQYLNWDNRQDRKCILASTYEAEKELVIFDELHKYRQWKNFVKGEFDKNKERHRYIVTGSARLDVYRRGGDSLLGRYHYYRLHPFSLAEALSCKLSLQPGDELSFYPAKKNYAVLKTLVTHGGFPEPFLAADATTLRRFHNERVERLVREDIRDLENVRDLSALEVLVDLIPGKVGSLFSVNALREDLQVTHKTVSHWTDILERMYYHFRLYPFASTKIKSLRKEPKVYLWDWSEVEDEAARFENVIASHLLKFVHYLHDAEGYKAELLYLRDIEGREVDFLVTINRKPWFAVEVKLTDQKPSKQLRYFAHKLAIPFSYQVIKTSNVDVYQDAIRIISADKFLSGLV